MPSFPESSFPTSAEGPSVAGSRRSRIFMVAGGAILAGLFLGGSIATVAFGLPPGDPARGEKIYERCLACHTIDRDRTGPRHAKLFGRVAGSVPGFSYSPAMRRAGQSGLVWNEETLDKFIESPTTFIPGTRMGYAGIKDPQERADLIAYLKAATR